MKNYKSESESNFQLETNSIINNVKTTLMSLNQIAVKEILTVEHRIKRQLTSLEEKIYLQFGFEALLIVVSELSYHIVDNESGIKIMSRIIELSKNEDFLNHLDQNKITAVRFLGDSFESLLNQKKCN